MTTTIVSQLAGAMGDFLAWALAVMAAVLGYRLIREHLRLPSWLAALPLLFLCERPAAANPRQLLLPSAPSRPVPVSSPPPPSSPVRAGSGAPHSGSDALPRLLYSPPSPAPSPAPEQGRTQTPPAYVVAPGDTLWGIAAHVLGTEDEARIARYWPRIHQLNRDLIGPNPNLIFPGQRLLLPEEDS